MTISMNELYADGAGRFIKGEYFGVPIHGQIRSVRAKTGTALSITIDLSRATHNHASIGETILVTTDSENFRTMEFVETND